MVKFKQHSIGYVCEDDLPIVLRLTPDGQMWINQTKVAPDRMGPLVAQGLTRRRESRLSATSSAGVAVGRAFNLNVRDILSRSKRVDAVEDVGLRRNGNNADKDQVSQLGTIREDEGLIR